ncbi:MAG: Gx transporter family protein [Clostridia bacterium]|nr:Gx transporter family protein [Clostridia bacterium]
MKIKTKTLVTLSIFTAIALVLSYVEALLPPIWSAVPGIKIGLPNIIIVFVLYRFSLKHAVAVSLVRILLNSLLFGNAVTLMYSLAGALLSLAVMALLKRIDRFSMVGVSVLGGVFHNLGQILVAMLVLETAEIGYYMIILGITGTVAGVLVGLLGSLVLKYTAKVKF